MRHAVGTSRGRRRAGALAGLAVLTALATGCGAGTDGPSGRSASPSPATPTELLLASVPDARSGSFRFTVDDGELNGSGAVHPTEKKLLMTTVYKHPELGFTMTMDFVVVDQRSWMRLAYKNAEKVTGLPSLPAGWLRLDRARMSEKDRATLGFDNPDPVNAGVLFRSATAVQRAADGRFTGTVDLTKAKEADVVDDAELTALGAAGQAVPFEAATDASGRLTSLILQVPATAQKPAHPYRATYQEYGAAPAVAEPAADQVKEAPAAAYEMISG